MIGGNANKVYWALRNKKSGECSFCMGVRSMRWDIAAREYHKAKKIGHRNVRRQVKQDLKQGLYD